MIPATCDSRYLWFPLFFIPATCDSRYLWFPLLVISGSCDSRQLWFPVLGIPSSCDPCYLWFQLLVIPTTCEFGRHLSNIAVELHSWFQIHTGISIPRYLYVWKFFYCHVAKHHCFIGGHFINNIMKYLISVCTKLIIECIHSKQSHVTVTNMWCHCNDIPQLLYLPL